MSTNAGGTGSRVGRARLADALLTLVVLAAGLAGAARAEAWQTSGRAPIDAVGYALVGAAALPLLIRRRWPLVTLAATTIATSAYLVMGYPFGPMLLAVAVAAYTVAARLPLPRALIAAAAALAVLLTHLFVGIGESEWVDELAGVVPGSAWIVVPFAIGATVRAGRESAARARAEQVRQVADEERLRIAQEVHDVVGHGLAAINMQSEIALHLLSKQPEQAQPALTAISRTSKHALDELRATLSVVRRDDGRAPGAGLARLDDLVARMSGTGVAVDVRIDGAPRELPAAVDLAAYRVVQESLTNVLRHAGVATATVRVSYLAHALEVEVIDDGAAGDTAGTSAGASAGTGAGGDVRAARDGDPAGHGRAVGGGAGGGVAGMRARVRALGGTFEAGPRPAGGFRVYARLPEAAAGGGE